MQAEPLEHEIAKLAEKLAQYPTSRLFAPLADAYRRAGRVAQAIEICERGLHHHSGYVAGQMVLARCYHESGELDLAASLYHQLLRADPENLTGLRALGEISEERDDVAGAEGWYRKALEIDPANPALEERIEALSARRAGEEVAEPEVEAEAPEEMEVAAPEVEAEAAEEINTVTLAEVYVEQGLYERALGIYRRILAEDPHNALIREKAEQLEGKAAEEQARLDAEAGAALGGFVPGGLSVTGEEVGVEDAEPWAFLLAEEADHDPDEVFAGPAANRGEGLEREMSSQERGSERGSDRGERSQEEGPEREASLGEDEDLKRFQEWLRSLK